MNKADTLPPNRGVPKVANTNQSKEEGSFSGGDLTDEQCDAVFYALHNWAMDVDPCDFGLPQVSGGGREAAREVIRKALRALSSQSETR